MSYIHGTPHISPSTGLGLESIKPELDLMESIDLSEREPRAGQGGLAGKQIAMGDGEQREQTKSLGEKAKGFFKTLGKVLGGIVLSPLLIAGGVIAGGALLAAKAISFIPRLVNEHILEPRAEAAFKKAHAPMLNDLARPMEGSVLEKEGVVGKLVSHAQNVGNRLSEQEIRDLVSTGERIAKALREPGGDKLPLSVTVGDNTHSVESGTYTTRALAWYMMAQAASQDVDRARLGDVSGTSEMVTEGSFVMKDEGNRLYNFLNSAPTCTSRISTHFEERTGHDETHKIGGLIPSSKVSQRGIEDYQSLMPGRGGTMLFDKLKPGQDGKGELFVKFEGVGCPPYFKKERHEGIGHAFTRFFAALDRNIGHATSFISTRFSGQKGPNTVTRQEHVYKGVLKNTISEPFKALVDKAISSGVIDANAKAVGKSVHKFGLPFVQDAIATIQQYARAQGNEEVLRQCSELIDSINEEVLRLGLVSDSHGIERRGAEVHISVG